MQDGNLERGGETAQKSRAFGMRREFVGKLSFPDGEKAEFLKWSEEFAAGMEAVVNPLRMALERMYKWKSALAEELRVLDAKRDEQGSLTEEETARMRKFDDEISWIITYLQTWESNMTGINRAAESVGVVGVDMEGVKFGFADSSK